MLSQDQELYQGLLDKLSNELIKISFQFEDRVTFQLIVAELRSYDVGPIPSNIELILNLPELEN